MRGKSPAGEHVEVNHWNDNELTASCKIGESWEDGAGSPIAVIDPATERTLARVSGASIEQTRRAVAVARQAFDGGPWQGTTPAERGTLLHRLCDLFEEKTEQLIEDLISETGSPTEQARTGQIGLAQETLRWFAETASAGPGAGYERELPLSTEPVTAASMLRLEPAGVVAAITAYNYPLVLLARKLGGVLASGCTCVVLPSERAPLATWRFFQMLDEVGYPPGVANLVIGSKEVGVELTTNPAVDMVSFTGSVAAGRAVMAQAAGTTKRVVLELGGKSPTIILPGADVAASVAPSILRFTMTAGQACGATTRTIVHRDVYDEYLEEAQSFVDGLRVGDPHRPGTDVGPLIRAEHRASVEGYVDRAVNSGATVLAGGGRPQEPLGYYMNPTYVGNIGNDAEIAQNELFGPVGVLMECDSADQAVAMANASRFGLAATVWGPSEEAMRVAQRLSAGTVIINGGGRMRPDAPWGGYRDSGNGREAGDAGFQEFFEVKHIQWKICKT